jgi:hypothetical protein
MSSGVFTRLEPAFVAVEMHRQLDPLVAMQRVNSVHSPVWTAPLWQGVKEMGPDKNTRLLPSPGVVLISDAGRRLSDAPYQ